MPYIPTWHSPSKKTAGSYNQNHKQTPVVPGLMTKLFCHKIILYENFRLLYSEITNKVLIIVYVCYVFSSPLPKIIVNYYERQVS